MSQAAKESCGTVREERLHMANTGLGHGVSGRCWRGQDAVRKLVALPS